MLFTTIKVMSRKILTHTFSLSLGGQSFTRYAHLISSKDFTSGLCRIKPQDSFHH